MAKRCLALFVCSLISCVALSQSIRDVDWKNFSYPISETPGVPAEVSWMPPDARNSVSLVAGRLKRGNCAGCPLITFDSASYGALAGIQSTVAVVVLTYHSGGTAHWQFVYVFAFRSGKPQLLAWLRTGSRADRGLKSARISEGDLLLAVSDPEQRQGDCCSAGSIVSRYRWQGSSFALTGKPVRQADPPSFDCRKASTPVEHLICQDAELSFLDSQMAESYREVLKQATDSRKQIIRRRQAEWFADYSRACNAPQLEPARRECIEQHLGDRLTTIWK